MPKLELHLASYNKSGKKIQDLREQQIKNIHKLSTLTISKYSSGYK